MKTDQFFMLGAMIYAAPQTPGWLAGTLAAIMFIVSILVCLRDARDTRGTKTLTP